jgi:CBS-domain-containing membrane protein
MPEVMSMEVNSNKEYESLQNHQTIEKLASDSTALEIERGDIENQDLPDFIKEQQQVHKSTENISNWRKWTTEYFDKFKGVEGKKAPPIASGIQMVYSSFLSLIGILLVSVTSYWYISKEFTAEENVAVTLITGSFGASAVILYDAYQSPLAQPRNVLGSYLISSFIGICTRLVCNQIGLPQYLSGSFAVALAILGMNLTRTVHPPGGACALIAVIGGRPIWRLGFGFILTSLGAAFIMLMVALLGNNLLPQRRYPQYWW